MNAEDAEGREGRDTSITIAAVFRARTDYSYPSMIEYAACATNERAGARLGCSSACRAGGTKSRGRGVPHGIAVEWRTSFGGCGGNVGYPKYRIQAICGVGLCIPG